jgi:hypothetical protein
MAVPDRLESLLAQNRVTGIDFVYVYPNQTQLDVYFLMDPAAVVPSLVGSVALSAIKIYSPSGGEWIANVPVTGIAWAIVDGRHVMRLTTSVSGDFSWYRLHIDDPRIDSFYNDVRFTFKANCPSQLDCAAPKHECPPGDVVDYPVDYTARDFWSFRQALLDFATARYPDWVDRLEADFGVMFTEVLSALGDEFAYGQDRIGREPYLELASQRRSVRRLARLVDYTMGDGLAASTWIDVQVAGGAQVILAGTAVSSPGGAAVFEIGRGLAESFALPPAGPKKYNVDTARNSFAPHLWDEHDLCLEYGSTDLYLEGKHAADIPLDDTPPNTAPGKWMLLGTNPLDPAIPARSWMIRVISVTDTKDLVFNTDITHIQWEPAQATPFELDLTVLQVHGNLLPATAGKQNVVRFEIGPSSDDSDHPSAIERTGPNASVAHLFSLPGSDQQPLAYLGPAAGSAEPELRMVEVTKVGPNWIPLPNREWTWTPAFLGVNSAQPEDRVFALDDGTWQRIAGYRRPTAPDFIHRDYATNDGKTIRFGNGEFGALPVDTTIFQVTFRLANGTRDNVTPGTLTKMPLGFVTSATNPLPAVNGANEESLNRVRQLAPEAFRAVTFRAVRPEDYAAAAELLPWVQKAGAAFLWTGSWITAFVTPDPKSSFEVTPDERRQLQDQLDRYRQAGRPAYTLNPIYANLDLEIVVCVASFAFKGEVEAAVLVALFGKGGVRPKPGFFSHENFTFGTPLERSRLESAIQAVPGVKAVEEIFIRRRGWFDWRSLDELVFNVGANEMIRVVNDPNFPERGSLTIDMRGGA